MTQEVNDIIYNTVCEANRKLTPGEVALSVARETGAHRKSVRLGIKDLVSQGQLAYTYVYGTSFLEPSFDRPVKLSKSVVVKPPQRVYQPQPGEVVIDIATGAAFGNGAHPSTCLALRAMDVVLGDAHYLRKRRPLTGLDVGTGTGILAIALAKLGVQRVLGIDIDPCALSEAAHNVQLNHLAEQITVSNILLEEVATSFSVIVANLAYPTLRELAPLFSAIMEKGGVLVLSGFKDPVSRDLSEAYTDQGLRLIQQETDREWVCFVLRKPRHT